MTEQPEFLWRDAPQPAPCPECVRAEKVCSWTFMADCEGCKARGIARLPQFREAQKAGVQTHAYRRLLEQVGLTHEAVRAAAQVDKVSQCE
jgi:hypothetical protein